MWAIIWAVLVGAVVGTIAKFIMPGDNEPKGFIMTAGLGIVGALVASFIGNSIGILGSSGIWGFISAIIGAIIVLFIYGRVVKPKA
jgi:uncharacterized membrane protein YeaQ/YmgE (transglycosylase-associated protein family)